MVIDDATAVTLVTDGSPPTAPAPASDEAAPGAGADRMFDSTVLALAIPVLFAQIGEAAILFTDTALLGRVGSAELAAIGLAETVLGVAVVPAVGLIGAMQIAVARRTGEQRRAAVAATFDRTLRLVIPAMAIVALVLHFGSGAYAERTIGAPAIAEAFTDYFRFGSLGLALFAVNLAYTALYVGISRTRILIGATTLMVLTNFVVSYALVFGRLGAPRLGIEGAGIGFAAAEALTLGYLAFRAWRQLGVGAQLLSARVVGGLPLGRLGSLGWPISGQLLIETLRWVAFLLIVERIGEQALAASSLLYACWGVLLIPAFAFQQTAYSLISTLIGRDEAERLPTLVRALIVRAYAFTLPPALLCALWPHLALSVFTTEQDIIAAATTPLRIVALVMLIAVPAEMWFAAVFGVADTAAGAAIELLSSIVLLAGAYMAAVLLELDLVFVWATLALAATVTLTASYARVRSGAWKAHQI